MKAWMTPLVLGTLLLPCCRTRHDVRLKVEPIHITMDINLRVERELEDIFADIEGTSEPEQRPAPKAKQPAKAPKGS